MKICCSSAHRPETDDTRAHLLQVAEALQPAPERLPLRIVWTMAIASGATVANLYYNQPLLPEIGRSFSASLHAVGLVPTLTQVGYGLGMLLVVPLGDARERRGLVVTCIGAAAVALVAIAFSPNLPWLLVASLVMGIATCVPQILVPFAAGLAPPGRRGRAVGTVMSGLLFGILLSRTLSGFVGAAVGWRVMYLVAAVLMIALAVAIHAELPRSEAHARCDTARCSIPSASCFAANPLFACTRRSGRSHSLHSARSGRRSHCIYRRSPATTDREQRERTAWSAWSARSRRRSWARAPRRAAIDASTSLPSEISWWASPRSGCSATRSGVSRPAASCSISGPRRTTSRTRRASSLCARARAAASTPCTW